jgi:hypothetical protein
VGGLPTPGINHLVGQDQNFWFEMGRQAWEGGRKKSARVKLYTAPPLKKAPDEKAPNDGAPKGTGPMFGPLKVRFRF